MKKFINFFKFWTRPNYNWINLMLGKRQITKRQSVWVTVLARCGRVDETSFNAEGFVTVRMTRDDILKSGLLPPNARRSLPGYDCKTTISIRPESYGATGETYLPDGPATIRLNSAVKKWRKQVKSSVTLAVAPIRPEATK